ncbi:MAG TPA: FAD-dependent oxidoreductase, partial [Candidatus Paenalcaligenes intestinipullorum]|nr:FAD-dependent oxidoreductase [Candidatus Paenalcaligenes intestinipullorum]
ALLVPKTQDGRVLFAVPWLGKVILGTTDTPTDDLSYEPKAFEQEIAFILREAGKYLQKAPTRADVRSVWVGLRPLVRPLSSGQDTKRLSREHTILISPSKLVTVTGGKWTTYRSMAEDVLQHVQQEGLLPHLPAATTAQHRLVGAQGTATAPRSLVSQSGVEAYGDEQALLQQLPGADRVLALGLTEAMVRFAARYEYAITVEDVLARRYRLLFLDSSLAAQVAPQVAEILREERATDPQLETFLSLCQQYQLA